MNFYVTKTIMICLFTFFLIIPVSHAGYVDFEGYILDSNEKPIDKTVKMAFIIYDSSGTNQWEVSKFVTVKKGNFHTSLGKIKEIDNNLFDGKHFIGVSVRLDENYQELPTRYKLTNHVSVSDKALMPTSLNTPSGIGDFSIEGKLIVKGTIESSGEIKVGNSESSCDNNTEGSIRYNYNHKIMEYCDGTNWKELGKNSTKNETFNSCKAILEDNPTANDGVYTIDPDGTGGHSPFEVYCDMSRGGWIVIQRRQNGEVDFYRDWVDYKDGFGSLTGEFWLGNDKIHILTNSVTSKLRIDLKNGEGVKKYAEYLSFSIDNESNKYRSSISGYKGNAGDSLSYHNNYNFTTKDSDNDNSSYRNCSEEFKGAWWYNACHYSNLNGFYYNGSHNSFADGIEWKTWTGYHYSLPFTEMKIK